MNIIFTSNGFYFAGKVKDLIKNISQFPVNISLQDLLRTKLN